MITIQSKKEGFRRCGIAHSRTPVSYPDDRFSDEELKILQGEPMLVVTVVPDADQASNIAKMTVAELTAKLQVLKVQIPDGAKKADLVALYSEALEQGGK